MSTDAALHVLVVDSDPVLQHLLATIFQRQGWRVTTTPDGETAVRLLGQLQPDVLVIDVLPRIWGLSVLEWISTTNASWLGHVVVLSAAPRKVLAEFMKTHASCHVMAKPFDITDLVANVQSCAAAQGMFERPSRLAGGEITP